MIIATSTGTRQAYMRYGAFSFEIKGKSLKPIVYKSAEDPTLDPFSYHSSTRHVVTRRTLLEDTWTLRSKRATIYEPDFNMAYNPYCAYSEAYSCPIPPVENKLPLRILVERRITNRNSCT